MRAGIGRWLVVLVVIGVIAASCGDDGEPDLAVIAEQLAPENEPAPEPDDVQPEADSADDAESEEETDVDAASIEKDMDFCVLLAEINLALNGFGPTKTPEENKEAVETAREKMAHAADVAPPELQEAVMTATEGFEVTAGAVEDADFIFIDLDLGALAALEEDPKYEEATYEIDKYDFDVCGSSEEPVPPTGPSLDEEAGDDGDIVLEGTVRDQIVAELVAIGLTQEEADCIAANLDGEANLFDLDQEAVFQLFAECEIPLERLAELGG